MRTGDTRQARARKNQAFCPCAPLPGCESLRTSRVLGLSEPPLLLETLSRVGQDSQIPPPPHRAEIPQDSVGRHTAVARSCPPARPTGSVGLWTEASGAGPPSPPRPRAPAGGGEGNTITASGSTPVLSNRIRIRQPVCLCHHRGPGTAVFHSRVSHHGAPDCSLAPACPVAVAG